MPEHNRDESSKQHQADEQASPSANSSPSFALLPEPFTVNNEAVGLAAAAARAALRRTTGALGRFSRPSNPPLLDPFRAAVEGLKLPSPSNPPLLDPKLS